MKNIHVLPTDKPSRLRYFCGKLEIMYAIPKKSDITFQNIYITSDEEIKEGDWVCNVVNNNIYNADKAKLIMVKENLRKIILTTDQDLIADGVQAIDDEFLEWFVKNPSCEWVNFEKEHDYKVPYLKMRHCEPYKIIIPKEEPKQETLEQTAVEWLTYKFYANEGIMKSEWLEQAKEMEQVQDTKRLLFFYKVSLIIGLKKTGKLLKEVDKEIKQEQTKSE